ncbi:MAG: hypothetical protein WCH43_06275 [Verrucomicrobiota bacterium]
MQNDSTCHRLEFVSSESLLKKTPLHDEHARRGAKIVEFGGWSMPVHYTSIIMLV